MLFVILYLTSTASIPISTPIITEPMESLMAVITMSKHPYNTLAIF